MPGGNRSPRHVVVMCVVACAAAEGSLAAQMPVAFEYDGGASSLMAVMNEAGDGAGGTEVFEGAGFRANLVNVFVADLRESEALSGAGVTLFVMWGNGSDPGGDFWSEVSVTPPDPVGDPLLVGEGIGEEFADASEIFALGEGVSVSPDGVSVFGEVAWGDQTPRGFAITNLQTMGPGELTLDFGLGGSIGTVGLFDWGDTDPYVPPDERCCLVLELYTVPLPPAIALAAAGLAGVTLLRRRMAG